MKQSKFNIWSIKGDKPQAILMRGLCRHYNYLSTSGIIILHIPNGFENDLHSNKGKLQTGCWKYALDFAKDTTIIIYQDNYHGIPTWKNSLTL